MRVLAGIVFDGQVAYTASQFERVFLVEDGWAIHEDNEQGRVSLVRDHVDITLWGYAYTLLWSHVPDPEPAPGPKKARR